MYYVQLTLFAVVVKTLNGAGLCTCSTKFPVRRYYIIWFLNAIARGQLIFHPRCRESLKTPLINEGPPQVYFAHAPVKIPGLCDNIIWWLSRSAQQLLRLLHYCKKECRFCYFDMMIVTLTAGKFQFLPILTSPPRFYIFTSALVENSFISSWERKKQKYNYCIYK